ncbi:MAG: hypothetical protein KF900_13990 [Bacteroidetes bacterium]|nr:hypothetical protein [Bacteroidota bacterium]
MLLKKEIIVVTNRPNALGTGIIPAASRYDETSGQLESGENQLDELNIKGAVDVEIINIGTMDVFIMDSVPIVAGSSYKLPNSTGKPFDDDIKIKWADDPRILSIGQERGGKYFVPEAPEIPIPPNS